MRILGASATFGKSFTSRFHGCGSTADVVKCCSMFGGISPVMRGAHNWSPGLFCSPSKGSQIGTRVVDAISFNIGDLWLKSHKKQKDEMPTFMRESYERACVMIEDVNMRSDPLRDASPSDIRSVVSGYSILNTPIASSSGDAQKALRQLRCGDFLSPCNGALVSSSIMHMMEKDAMLFMLDETGLNNVQSVDRACFIFVVDKDGRIIPYFSTEVVERMDVMGTFDGVPNIMIGESAPLPPSRTIYPKYQERMYTKYGDAPDPDHAKDVDQLALSDPTQVVSHGDIFITHESSRDHGVIVAPVLTLLLKCGRCFIDSASSFITANSEGGTLSGGLSIGVLDALQSCVTSEAVGMYASISETNDPLSKIDLDGYTNGAISAVMNEKYSRVSQMWVTTRSLEVSDRKKVFRLCDEESTFGMKAVFHKMYANGLKNDDGQPKLQNAYEMDKDLKSIPLFEMQRYDPDCRFNGPYDARGTASQTEQGVHGTLADLRLAETDEWVFCGLNETSERRYENIIKGNATFDDNDGLVSFDKIGSLN